MKQWKKILGAALSAAMLVTAVPFAESQRAQAASGDIPITVQYFGSEGFVNWLKSNLDGNRDNVLSTSERSITEIKCGKYAGGITSIKGLSYFPNLKKLTCRKDNLTSLDLSGCSSLLSLYCENNQLSSLDLSGAPNLRILNCQGNSFTTLNIGPCSNLVYAYQNDEDGEIRLITDEGAPYYQYSASSDDVSLSHTRDLYVNKNVTIQAIATAIRIDANNFPDAAFRNYILQNVDANHNQELENDEIKTTSSMNVSSKGISNMTGLKYFTALTQLDCSYNSISALDLTNAPRLVRLECVANNLTTLSVVKNTNISYIDCTDNAALTKLETYVYNSAIATIKCNNTALTSLNTDMMPNLYELRCDGCRIGILDLSACTKLAKLSCKNNNGKLMSLTLGENNVLTTVDCSGNSSLVLLDVNGCYNLKYAVEHFTPAVNGSTVMYQGRVGGGSNQTQITLIKDASTILYGQNQTIQCTVGVKASPNAGGTVSGGGVFEKGTSVTIQATPANRYSFRYWLLNGSVVSNTPVYTFDVQSDGTYTAVFEVSDPNSVAAIFDDIPVGAWYEQSVQYVYDRNIMSGKGQSKTNPSKKIFGPNANITRAEFVTVLYNRQNRPNAQYRAVFSDVPDGKWYTDPVLWAYENHITSGYGAKFGINDPITREQMAKMLYEYAKLLGGNMNYDESAWANFGDTNKVSGYAVEALKWATSKGVINGSKGADDAQYMIRPKGNATRAECSAMIKNLIEKVLTN